MKCSYFKNPHKGTTDHSLEPIYMRVDLFIWAYTCTDIDKDIDVDVDRDRNRGECGINIVTAIH